MTVFTALASVNWIAVLLSVVAYTVLGGLWFAGLFAKHYAASLGRESTPKPEQPALFFGGPAVATLFVVTTTAALMRALDINAVGDALVFALVIGIGFLAANTVIIAINPNMPRPLFYSLISGSYHLVGIVITALILVAFG
ncbi:Protein of unknown function [Lentzea fradiae]|uniref:DUF1761 domain-containing protein n=1 Tax=Lentzea fradiae TaxID=200378 RepID=A0A1G7KFS9_9PSEU|nr:DUF1761 domain-containing protein [Lentzea fradiae]SDF35901.1 Protein of unknown function [Lentzea fradiae]